MRMDGFDWLITGVLGLFATAFIWALSYRGLHPSVWGECALAVGLRPPTTLLSGHWRLIARGIYACFGVAGGGMVLSILGKIAVGVIVAFGYLLCREALAILVRIRIETLVWTHRLSRQISIVAALLLLCADPVWTIGQSFSPATLLALEFLISAYLLAHFLRSGSMGAAYCSMLILGFFAAVSPMGIGMIAFFWGAFYLLLRRGALFNVQILNPLVMQTSRWILTFNWAAGFLIGIALNVCCFIMMDGLAATGRSLGAIPFSYAVELWGIVTSAASTGGWIVGFGFVVMPFVLVVALLKRATDVEYVLSYRTGLIFFLCLCFAYSQVSAFQPLWFWCLSDSVTVNSPLILFVGSVLSMLAIVGALSVLVVDTHCRNYRRLAEMFGDEQKDAPQRRTRRLRRVLFGCIAVLLLAGALPGRWQPKTLRMHRLIADFTREIVDEAGDARWLFTDGQLDCGIELEAVRRHGLGGGLRCIPLMRTRQAREPYALRRLMENDADRLCAEIGGGNILRTWQKDEPEKIAVSAMMLGLELWKVRGGRDYPPVSGVLARTTWPSDEVRETGIRHALELIGGILTLYGEGGPDPRAGRYVNDLFLVLQWRLARLARIRSEIFDRRGDLERAQESLAMAEALDDRNASLKRIHEGMMRLRENTMRQMTPREGLQFALVRADFPLARRYAEPILDSDPEDADANFGMGMSYLMEEQYNRAEEYLKRSLVRKPKEPAIWNNIAVIQYRLGRLAEARKNALRALELLPDSAEVKDTLKKIDEAEKKSSSSAKASPAATNAAPEAATKE
ncbi:MAG: tetratricopeptide repeat protein [Kiritimatiellia bacterium]